ncbi:MAG: histidine kinase [Oscillospiraceae bacterium]|nr:histidine kinase [Oscillospiraceae bacterium]
MKNPKLKRDILVEISIALSAAIGLFIAIFVCIRPGIKFVAPSVNSFFILKPQSVTEEIIQDYAGVERIYEFDLSEAPSSAFRGQSLFVYLRHTSALLELEGKTSISTEETLHRWHIGRTPGNYWLSLKLSEEYRNSKLRITLIPVYDSVRDYEPTFFIIDREPLINMIIFPQEGHLLALGALAVAAGIFLSLTALVLGLKPKSRQLVFYLGAISAFAGFWKLCNLSIVPLLLDHLGQHKAIWFIGIISYMLMLLFSLRFLTLLRRDGHNQTGIACCSFAAALSAILLTLQIFGIVELHEAAIWYGIGIVSLHFLAILGQKPSKSELLWVLPTSIALGADLLILLRFGSIAKAPSFIIWILANLFIRGFGFLHIAVRQERELEVKDEELRGAKMQALINQIQPHFIYNTLATIHMICGEDPKRAMHAIEDFSDYLHSNFDALAATEPILFKQELEHTKAYLNVEMARYAEKLTVDYYTDYITFSLPPLTLQPIVENSIKHGLKKTHRPMHIVITTRAVDGGAEITVEDNGVGYEPAPDGAVHVGLKNVRERLSMMCSGTLNIVPRSGGGTVVTVFVPSGIQN